MEILGRTTNTVERIFSGPDPNVHLLVAIQSHGRFPLDSGMWRRAVGAPKGGVSHGPQGCLGPWRSRGWRRRNALEKRSGEKGKKEHLRRGEKGRSQGAAHNRAQLQPEGQGKRPAEARAGLDPFCSRRIFLHQAFESYRGGLEFESAIWLCNVLEPQRRPRESGRLRHRPPQIMRMG